LTHAATVDVDIDALLSIDYTPYIVHIRHKSILSYFAVTCW